MWTTWPFEEYISALEAGRFDLYLGEVALTADFDLSALLASDGALNYGRWQDEQTDQLLAALAAAPMDSREEAASALYAYLGQRVPLVPVCFKKQLRFDEVGKTVRFIPGAWKPVLRPGELGYLLESCCYIQARLAPFHRKKDRWRKKNECFTAVIP